MIAIDNRQGCIDHFGRIIFAVCDEVASGHHRSIINRDHRNTAMDIQAAVFAVVYPIDKRATTRDGIISGGVLIGNTAQSKLIIGHRGCTTER